MNIPSNMHEIDGLKANLNIDNLHRYLETKYASKIKTHICENTVEIIAPLIPKWGTSNKSKIIFIAANMPILNVANFCRFIDASMTSRKRANDIGIKSQIKTLKINIEFVNECGNKNRIIFSAKINKIVTVGKSNINRYLNVFL